VRGGSHFFPGFLQRGDDFFFGCFCGEIGELTFQENEAEGVFENTAFGIRREILFQIQILHTHNYCIGITDFAQDFASAFGVETFKVGPPFQIAGAIHGVGIARDFPATQMLAAGGEAQFFRGVRRELQHPISQPLGVDKFARVRNATDGFEIGVARILLVKAAQGGFEARGIGWLEF